MTTLTGERKESVDSWISKINDAKKALNDAKDARNAAYTKYDSLRLKLDDNPTAELASQVSAQGLVLDSLKKKEQEAIAKYERFINSHWQDFNMTASKTVEDECFTSTAIVKAEKEVIGLAKQLLEAQDKLNQVFFDTFIGARSDVKPLDDASMEAKDATSYPNYSFYGRRPGMFNDAESMLKSFVQSKNG